MRSSVAWLLALFLIPRLAAAENMAAAAEKEQKRRQTVDSGDKADSFDDQDLAEVHKTRRDARATPVPSATKPPNAPSSEVGLPPPDVAVPAAPADNDDGHSRGDEQTWKRRAREARQRVRSAEREAQQAEKARDYWRDGACKSYGNGYCSPSVLENSSAQRAYLRAQGRLTDAKEELDALEEEARHASVPPGWLRD